VISMYNFLMLNLAVRKVTGRRHRVNMRLSQNELQYVSHYAKAPILSTVTFLAILCSTLASFSFIAS
jgi:hypothetical protein